MAKKHGVTVKDIYWTQGRYDIVTITKATDDMAACALIEHQSVGEHPHGNAAGILCRGHADHHRQDGLTSGSPRGKRKESSRASGAHPVIRKAGASVRLAYGRLRNEVDRHAGAFARGTPDVDVGLGILAQDLQHERANLSRNRPRSALGQTDSIICDDDPAAFVILLQAFEGDHASSASVEGVLESIGHEFIDQ